MGCQNEGQEGGGALCAPTFTATCAAAKHDMLQRLTSRVKDSPAFIVAPFAAEPQRLPLPKQDLAVAIAPLEVTFGAPKVTALLPAVREMIKL